MKRGTKRPERKPVVEKGLTFDVRGTELAVRMSQRIRWHRKRAEMLGTELKKLMTSFKSQERALDDWRRDSAIETMGKRIREHEQRSVFLAFVRDHLKRRLVYRLDGDDLRLIEIMPDSIHWL